MKNNNNLPYHDLVAKHYNEFLNRRGPNHPDRQKVAQLQSERKRGAHAGIAKMLHHLQLSGYNITIHIDEPLTFIAHDQIKQQSNKSNPH